MKRRDLVRTIEALGAVFVRDKGPHTIYVNPRTNRILPVPRHTEVKETTARRILRDAAE